MQTAEGPDILGAFDEGQEAGRQKQIKDVLGQAYAGQEGAMEQLGTLDPAQAMQLQQMFNARDTQSLKSMFTDSAVAVNLKGSAFRQFLINRAKRITRGGGDAADTIGLLEMPEKDAKSELSQMVSAGQHAGILPAMAKADRKTSVVDGNLVDTNTGEVVFSAEEGTSDLDKAKTEKVKVETEKLRQDMEMLGSASVSAEDKIKIEANLRQEVFSRAKDFETVDDAWRRVQVSGKDPSAAGDLALIFNYMKMLDPGSTVREGEFATAAASAGLPERLVGLIKKAESGERLTAAQRKDFMGRAEKLYGAAQGKHDELTTKYNTLAEQYGVDPANVILESASEEAINQLPEGTIDNGDGTFTLPTGETVRKKSGNS